MPTARLAYDLLHSSNLTGLVDLAARRLAHLDATSEPSRSATAGAPTPQDLPSYKLPGYLAHDFLEQTEIAMPTKSRISCKTQEFPPKGIILHERIST